MSSSQFLNDLMHLGDRREEIHHELSVVGSKSLLAQSDSTVSAAVGGRKIAAISTVSFHFRIQLEDLMKTLRATQPHYIKCVKPNGTKSAAVFDSSLAMQ